ncbi:MAG: hypothetical protein RJB38_2007 [Pseudomonadota bacterium]
MITWLDFILDERFGPLLAIDSREESAIDGADVVSVMEDGGGHHIQETRQVRRPARMAGKSSLEFNAASRMDAGAASAPVLSRLP